jgi:tryptophan 2,3-dioxygenase
MTFDDLWQTLPIPAGYAKMDPVEQRRWQALVEAAFRSGLIDHAYSKRLREMEEEVVALKAELRRMSDLGCEQ